MAFMLARRSRVVFRHLNVAEPSFAPGLVSLPLRVAVSSSSINHSNSGIFGTPLPSIASNSYATTVGKPKAHTGKAKASSKPEKSATTGTEKPAKKTTTAAAKSKSKPKGRPKKVVSKEEKHALKEKEERRALKQAVLKTPKQLPASAYTVLLTELIREKGFSNVSEAARQASETYKNLPLQQRQVKVSIFLSIESLLIEDDKEHEQTAESNKALNHAAYEAWVQSHTPLQIKEANHARAKLRKNGAMKRLPTIIDSRQVKRPANAMLFYASEQRAAGHFKDMSLGDGTKEMFKRYSQLSEHEKQVAFPPKTPSLHKPMPSSIEYSC